MEDEEADGIVWFRAKRHSDEDTKSTIFLNKKIYSLSFKSSLQKNLWKNLPFSWDPSSNNSLSSASFDGIL